MSSSGGGKGSKSGSSMLGSGMSGSDLGSAQGGSGAE